MIQEYADKIKNKEISEERAMTLLKHTISLPEKEIRELLDLGENPETEEQMKSILKK